MKIWEGNDETVHYFHSETAWPSLVRRTRTLAVRRKRKRKIRRLAKRRRGPSAEEAPAKRGPSRRKEATPRARHVELHEHTAVGRSSKLNRKGLSVDHYSAQDKLFEIIQGEGDSANARRLFSISEILNAVMDVGRRGIQIQRFKGWVK